MWELFWRSWQMMSSVWCFKQHLGLLTFRFTWILHVTKRPTCALCVQMHRASGFTHFLDAVNSFLRATDTHTHSHALTHVPSQERRKEKNRWRNWPRNVLSPSYTSQQIYAWCDNKCKILLTVEFGCVRRRGHKSRNCCAACMRTVYKHLQCGRAIYIVCLHNAIWRAFWHPLWYGFPPSVQHPHPFTIPLSPSPRLPHPNFLPLLPVYCDSSFVSRLCFRTVELVFYLWQYLTQRQPVS